MQRFIPLLLLLGCARVAQAVVPVSITILHTNDLHSHFRSEKTPLALGGIARLKTAIQAVRAKTPDALLVDGGDWSEGEIYYTEGGGVESLRMMDHLGYDVAVVGNHDWLNGPDHLIEAVQKAHPKMSLVGANFQMKSYARAAEFKAAVSPYVIREISGARVAFIGLVNFDPVYAPYLSPVTTTDPVVAAARLATQLKNRPVNPVDAVVVISHNFTDLNRIVLETAVDVDLMIGAHDHQKYNHPIVVNRPGHPDAWLVEAGSWGRYLGRVDLKIKPRLLLEAPKVELVQYGLTQIDRSIPEAAETVARVDALEARIESRMGPVFHDHVADSQLELYKGGVEVPIGNFMTDAYRATTGVDIALEQNNFIYNELHEGVWTSADLFRANPPIFNLETGKTWTLHTWKMRGAVLSVLFRLLYTWRKTITAGSLSFSGGLSFSGMEVTFDPNEVQDSLGLGDLLNGLGGKGPVQELTVRGQPIDSTATYTIAASAGIAQALRMMDKKMLGLLPFRDLQDTGVEGWRAARDYAHAMGVVTADKVRFGGRVRTTQPDLGIVYEDFKWFPMAQTADGSIIARVQTSVRNYGGVASSTGASVTVMINSAGADSAVDAEYDRRLPPQDVPSLAPGESRLFVWERVEIPMDRGLYPLSAAVWGCKSDINSSNDLMTRFFTP